MMEFVGEAAIIDARKHILRCAGDLPDTSKLIQEIVEAGNMDKLENVARNLNTYAQGIATYVNAVRVKVN